MRQKVLLFILLVTAQNLYTADIQITGKELGAYFTPEYNRTFNFCWALSAVGAARLNGRHTVKSGLSLGASGDVFDIKAFAGGEAALPVNFPLYVSASYNYNGLPQYEAHTHSVLPLVSLKWRRAGVSLGTNLRFTSFFGEPPVFEPELSCSIYVHIIDNEFLQLGLGTANFDNFTYGNFGAYFLSVNSLVRLNKQFSLVNELELHQGGSVALASNFYGIIYRAGVVFLW